MAEPERASAPAARFTFAKLLVSDLERSRAFYVDVLGMREKARYGRPDLAEVELEYAGDPAGPTLVLMQWVPARKPVVEVQPGHVGIVVADAGALFARAQAAGATVTEEPRRLPELGVWVGFLADPDGYAIEIVQPG